MLENAHICDKVHMTFLPARLKLFRELNHVARGSWRDG